MSRTFGAVLRDCRKEHDLSQAGLADITGIHQTMISLFENDKDLPTIGEVAVFERALGMSRGAMLIASGWVTRPTSVEACLEQDADLTPDARDSLLGAYNGVVAGIKRRRELRRKDLDLRADGISEGMR